MRERPIRSDTDRRRVIGIDLASRAGLDPACVADVGVVCDGA